VVHAVVRAEPWLRSPTRTGPRAVAEREPEPRNPPVIHALPAGRAALAGRATARSGRWAVRSGRWVRPTVPDGSTGGTEVPEGSAAPGGGAAARAGSMRKAPQDSTTKAAPSGPRAATGAQAWGSAGTAIRAGRMMGGPAGTPPAAGRVGGPGIAARRGLTRTAWPARQAGQTACGPSGRNRTCRRTDRIPAPRRPDRIRRRSPRAARARGACPSRVPGRRHSRRCACRRHHRSHH
jgi:hypothetical protein